MDSVFTGSMHQSQNNQSLELTSHSTKMKLSGSLALGMTVPQSDAYPYPTVPSTFVSRTQMSHVTGNMLHHPVSPPRERRKDRTTAVRIDIRIVQGMHMEITVKPITFYAKPSMAIRDPAHRSLPYKVISKPGGGSARL